MLEQQPIDNTYPEPARTRTRLISVAGALAVALVLVPVAAAQRGNPARTARVMNVSDNAKLRYVPPVRHGTKLLEVGEVKGTLPGSMRALVEVSSNASGSFTFKTASGEIDGNGSAKLNGSGTWQSFSGTLVITGGTGRYAHAHGRAGLYGLYNRQSYAMIVQTRGSLSY